MLFTVKIPLINTRFDLGEQNSNSGVLKLLLYKCESWETLLFSCWKLPPLQPAKQAGIVRSRPCFAEGLGLGLGSGRGCVEGEPAGHAAGLWADPARTPRVHHGAWCPGVRSPGSTSAFRRVSAFPGLGV